MRIFVLTMILVGSAFAVDIEGLKLPEGEKTALEAFKIDDRLYIKSTTLAKFLGGEESIDFFAKSGSIDFGEYDIEYSLFSSYVRCGENVYNIYQPVQFDNGAFLLPIRYTIEILNRVSPLNLAWDGEKIIVSPPVFNVNGISASQKLNGILIEISLKEKLRFDVVKTDDNWLILTVSEGKVDSLAFTRRIPVPAIYNIKTYQFERSAQISVRIRPRDFTFSSKLKDDPYRIQILLKGDSFSDSAMTSEHLIEEDFADNRIDVIVIDPGHGGDDLGAVGPRDTKEKDMVLSISKKLFDLLNKDRRFEPVMTRQDDIFIPLSERTSLANSVGGDMLISIHANASENKKARGLITFFLADAKTDQARAAATLENSSIRFENVEDQRQYLTDLDFTLRDMIQTQFQRESADLADIIQKEVSGATKIRGRGVDQAGFFVLDKAYMPAVLVETAFISNKDDEKILKDKGFQKKCARAIYDSIVAFKEKYESIERISE
ncbi:MAG: N-acetylmuramoyl-L-alanine amidase [candidate division Zixibacteria bacterium]